MAMKVDAGEVGRSDLYGMEVRMYKFDWDAEQAEEIEAMWCTGFTPDPENEHPRDVWIAIGWMALGKSIRVAAQVFDDEEPYCTEWAACLKKMAERIFEQFKPGDGQL